MTTKTERVLPGGRLTLEAGDLTEAQVEVIVNAANSSLMGGGGVDGAIHRKGGPQILEECKALRRSTFPQGLPTGEVALTAGGNLPASYVIHTVGPIYRQAGEDAPALLASCYRKSLELAKEKGLLSIAFPAISTGVYGYPLSEAAQISLDVALQFLQEHPNSLREIRFVLFGLDAYQTFLDALTALEKSPRWPR